MEERIKGLLDKLTLEELKILGSDSCSTPLFRDLVDAKIESLEKKPICAVCGDAVDTSSNYTVIFGPPDLRKKAHFCALDCMEYFITRLKDTQKKRKGKD